MKITIDGKTIEIEGQMTVLEAARENGFVIPSLCDHPRLEPFSGCRLCIVEIKGRRGYVPSCSASIEEGMEVKTDSPALRRMRRQIMELILIEHPSACLVCTEKKNCDEFKSTIRKVGETTGCVLCPNNGRCELQDVVEILKIDRVGFPAVYRNIEVKKSDPFFDRNYNLCILCGRCVRICHEVRGASVLTFIGRGSEEVVGTSLDKPLVEAGCQFCGACVDVCPTGALVERTLRYETLPEERKRTICPLCSVGCALDTELRSGRIISTRPSVDSPVNRGQACVKGRFTVKDMVHSSKRILKPMIRRKKELEEVDWDEAMDFAAQKLKVYRGHETAFVRSSQVSCEDGFIGLRFAREALKTSRITDPSGVSPLFVFDDFMRRRGLGTLLNFEIAKIAGAESIWLLGVDPTVSHPIIWLEVLQAVQNGSELVVVSPVDFGLGRHASLVLDIEPGSEAFLLGFLAKSFLGEEAAADCSNIPGFEALEKMVSAVSEEQTLRQTGLPGTALHEAVRIFQAGQPSLFLFGMGFAAAPEAEQSLSALWNLARASRATMLPLGLDNNERGLLEILRTFPGKGMSPGRVMAAVKAKRLKAVYQTGPFLPFRRTKPEFWVVQESFMDPRYQKADVLLPAAIPAETRGTFVNVEGRIQTFEPLLDPPGEARPEWWIFSQLAQKMGVKGFDLRKSSSVSNEMRKDVPALMKGAGKFVGEKKEGTAEFTAVKFPAVAPMTAKKYAYRLVVIQSMDSFKSLDLSQEIRSLRIVRDTHWLMLAPRAAEGMAIKTGDPVIVESASGRVAMVAKIDDRVPEKRAAVFYSSLLMPLSPDGKLLNGLPVRILRGN